MNEQTQAFEGAGERPLPLIDQWLAQGKYTCTIKEFSELYKISYERAREFCFSKEAPPGFYSGTHFKIDLPSLQAHMSEFSKKRRTINA